MQPVASTSRAIGIPEFRRVNFPLPEKYGRYTGDGFVTKPPVFPMRRGESWATNTSLELGNIVYPDGTLKNASIAQSKFNDEKERAAAAAKIEDLQKQLTFVPLAVRPQLQAQIVELRQKYFPGQLAEEKNAARHADVIAEMKTNKNTATSERGSIYNQLKAILGAFGGASSRAPAPTPTSATGGILLEEKMVESIVDKQPSAFTGAKPTTFDQIFDLLRNSSGPNVDELYKNTIQTLEAATPSTDITNALYRAVFEKSGYDPADFTRLTIDPTVTTASDALKSIQDRLGAPPATATASASLYNAPYNEEKSVVFNINDNISQEIKDKIGDPFKTTAEIVKLLDPAVGILGKAEKQELFNSTVFYLDKLKAKEMDTPARVYLFQLALLEKGADPGLAESVQSAFNTVSKWETARGKVDEYLAVRAKVSRGLSK